MLLCARLAQSTEKHIGVQCRKLLGIHCFAEEAQCLVYWKSDESLISFVGTKVPCERAFFYQLQSGCNHRCHRQMTCSY